SLFCIEEFKNVIITALMKNMIKRKILLYTKYFHTSLNHKPETIPDDTGYISVDGHH
ncbi:20910_t:CDS:1, partial [Gigaspora rosea]